MLPWRVPKNSGFTLIEMITVVIIFGVVAAIAAPNLMAFFSRNRVNVALQEVEGALREAQKQAIRNGRSCTIAINAALPTDPANTNLSNPLGGGGCLIGNRILNDPNNSDLIVLNSNRNPLVFSGKGNITIPAANLRPVFVITLPNAINDQRCVVIESSLGSMRTGNYTGNPNGILNPDNCQ